MQLVEIMSALVSREIAPVLPEMSTSKFGNSTDHGPRKAATGKVPEFDEGGIVPGPFGQAVPIIAHAQEWVLNSGQVNRIAGMLGTSRDSLRSMMGFYGGGAAGFQGGGEPAAGEIPALTTKDVKGIDSRSLRRMVVALRRIGRVFAEAAVEIGNVEEWSGFLDQRQHNCAEPRTGSRQEDASERRAGTDFDRGIRAFMDGVDGMLAETIGMFAKLRASIERRTTVRARKLAAAAVHCWSRWSCRPA